MNGTISANNVTVSGGMGAGNATMNATFNATMNTTMNGTFGGNGSVAGLLTGNGTRNATEAPFEAVKGVIGEEGEEGLSGDGSGVPGGSGGSDSPKPIAVILLPAPSPLPAVQQGAAVPLPVSNGTGPGTSPSGTIGTAPAAASILAPGTTAALAAQEEEDDLGLFQDGNDDILPPGDAVASAGDGGLDEEAIASIEGDAAVASEDEGFVYDDFDEVVSNVTSTATETTTNVTTLYSDGTESTRIDTDQAGDLTVVEDDGDVAMPLSVDFQTATRQEGGNGGAGGNGGGDHILASTEGFVGLEHLVKEYIDRQAAGGRRLTTTGADKYATASLKMHATQKEPPLLTGIVSATADKAGKAGAVTTFTIDDDADHEEDESYDDGDDDNDDDSHAFQVASAYDGGVKQQMGGNKMAGVWDSSWSTTARWYGSSSTPRPAATTPAVYGTYTGGSSLWPTTGTSSASSSSSSSSSSGKVASSIGSSSGSSSSRIGSSGSSSDGSKATNLVPSWGVSGNLWADDAQGSRPSAAAAAPGPAAGALVPSNSRRGGSSSISRGSSSSSIQQGAASSDFWADPSLWSSSPVGNPGTSNSGTTKPPAPVKTVPVPAPAPAPTAGAIPPGSVSNSNSRNSRPSPAMLNPNPASSQPAPAKAASSGSSSSMGQISLDDLWNDPSLWDATPLPMRSKSNGGDVSAGGGGGGGGGGDGLRSWPRQRQLVRGGRLLLLAVVHQLLCL
jgi:hypothetical protein